MDEKYLVIPIALAFVILLFLEPTLIGLTTFVLKPRLNINVLVQLILLDFFITFLFGFFKILLKDNYKTKETQEFLKHLDSMSNEELLISLTKGVLVEESLFRLFIPGIFLGLMLSLGQGILYSLILSNAISIVIFSYLHIGRGNDMFINCFIGGTIVTYLLFTQGILASSIAHYAVNIAIIIMPEEIFDFLKN